jgi:hypothetical protein
VTVHAKDNNPARKVVAWLPALISDHVGTFRTRQAEMNIEEECFDGYPASFQWP